MSDTRTRERESAAADEAGTEPAVYVYGVLPSDVEVDPEATGVGDPPAPIALIAHGGVAALVTEVVPGTRLGTPQDFAAHARVLDSAANEVPVLPLRFGAVMTDREAVVEQFLEPYEQRFTEMLRTLEGRSQVVIKGRYRQDTLLREIIDRDPRAQRLRERIASVPEAACRDERIMLGELVGKTVEARRAADTGRFAQRLDGLGVQYELREPTHEFDAIHLACLLKTGDFERVRQECARFAGQQENRIEVRLVGPMAAYDFVDAAPPEG